MKYLQIIIFTTNQINFDIYFKKTGCNIQPAHQSREHSIKIPTNL